MNAATGIVTAQDKATGKTFQFSAASGTLSGLQVGQSIYADYSAGKVSVNPATPCCSIVNPGLTTQPNTSAPATALQTSPAPFVPCCGITAVNAATGIVTAQDKATGKTFQFSAPSGTLSGLQVGQAIYADYNAGQVSVNPGGPCCSIVGSGMVKQVRPGAAPLP